MKYLLIKMRRDISSMWVQFFAVFMMSVLAITIYSGMEGVWYGLKCEVDIYFEANHLADVWVNAIEITDDAISRIGELEDVEEYQLSMTSFVRLNTEDNDKPDIKLIATDTQDLFSPEIINGEDFDAACEDGIWLDHSIAEERDLQTGDKITLYIGSKEKEFEIKALILSAEFVYYTGSVTDTVPKHEMHGYGMIGTKAAEGLYGGLFSNELRMKVSEDSDLLKLQKNIENILEDSYHSFASRDDIPSVSQITKEIAQMQNMANLFSAVFIVLALLSMYTTMTRLVNTQMIQIGTLKAVGFTNGKIRLHYALYSVFIALIGCLLGTIFGRLIVSEAVMRIKKATLTLPVWQVQLSFRTYAIIALIVLICLGATMIAVKRGLKNLPAETMRAQTTGSKQGHVFDMERFSAWNKLGDNTKWMIRDILQNKVRWLMSIIGVCGSMVLMMAGLGFMDSINYSNEYVYEKQYTYSQRAVFVTGYTQEAFDEAMDLIDGDHQLIYENSMELYGKDDKKVIRTISVLDNGAFIHLETLDNQPFTLGKDSVAISKKLAQNLDISIGDTMKCRVIGEKDYLNLAVTDIVISPSPQGIFLSSEYWEELDRPFAATAVLLSQEKDYNIIRDLDVIKESVYIEDQFSDMLVMTKSVMSIVYLMIVASVLLGAIIIYNLGMLNYIERYREYATMKVLGFYQREVRNIIIRDCLITTLIGWGIGIPIGYWFLQFYIGIVQFNTFEWVPTLRIWSLIIASVAVIACSLVVNLIVAHKVTKISMVEALKSVE